MEGDDRARFCRTCSLNVFNVSELSELEVRELIAKKGGVCGRIFKRKDGTVMTRDCPTGVRALRLRFLRGLTAAATLLTGLVGYRASTRDPSCSTLAEGEPTAFRRIEISVENRFVELRETLRETDTFGPLIDRWSPLPRYTMGRIFEIRPISTVAPSPPAE